jgi:hypothetical protein
LQWVAVNSLVSVSEGGEGRAILPRWSTQPKLQELDQQVHLGERTGVRFSTTLHGERARHRYAAHNR